MQTKLRNIMSSRKGFTLIELLVVIGILAVLAAIAIPSVAGLIDRANVSADKTNANEMTNALERFTSEYELYCQDIASGWDGTNCDSAQGRVKNVVGVTDRTGVTKIEVGNNITSGVYATPGTLSDGTTALDAKTTKAIYRDTKYAVNYGTMKAIVENYTKTSSATFQPKQSDCHFYYSPQCGLVVVALADADDAALDALVQSGMDAKGNPLSGTGAVDVQWIDLTAYYENETDAAKLIK
jgi:prepilin-type N-terminal cleavage/methylation domain-containing protein